MKKIVLFFALFMCVCGGPTHAVSLDGVVPGIAIGALTGGIVGAIVGADVAVAPYTGGLDGGNMLVYLIGYTGVRMLAGGLQGILVGGLVGGAIGFLVCPSSETMVSGNVTLTK